MHREVRIQTPYWQGCSLLWQRLTFGIWGHFPLFPFKPYFNVLERNQLCVGMGGGRHKDRPSIILLECMPLQLLSKVFLLRAQDLR